MHLFDQLEFNLHDPIPTSDQSATQAAPEKQPKLKPMHPQASAEIPFAPMSSRDLEGDYAVPPSRLGAASSTEGGLSRSLDSRTTQKSKVRLVCKIACTQSIYFVFLGPTGDQQIIKPNREYCSDFVKV